MEIKGITDEDFVNYKFPCMFIASPTCTFKCEKESGVRCCQNSDLAKQKAIDVDPDTILMRYMRNPITKAICFGGLEPFDSFYDIMCVLSRLRITYECDDPIIVYTGYNKTEILKKLDRLKDYKNVIVKFGRYIPNQEPHYDDVLGVMLASPNQYAEVIS